MKLSRQFEKALVYATRAHSDQTRRKTGIPYIAHILGVTAIAMEYGANETEAIAALLHDAVEDSGGAKRLRDIERKFGKTVTKIVDGCTDTYETPKPPWREGRLSCASQRLQFCNTPGFGLRQTAQHARDPR
jgi:(p)ppGpp synthase/HD superfamily hydrolase